MVLPKADLGASARGLAAYAGAGATPNARFASMHGRPSGHRVVAEREVGRVLGLRMRPTSTRDLASLSVRKGTLSLSTGVELLHDNVYAAQYLHARLTDYERLKGPVRPGLKLRNVPSFDVAGIGDEGGGVRATVLISRA